MPLLCSTFSICHCRSEEVTSISYGKIELESSFFFYSSFLNRFAYFSGDSLLHLSAFSGNEPAGLFLLGQGAQPNHANKKGETPLHAASLKGHESLVRELLKR